MAVLRVQQRGELRCCWDQVLEGDSIVSHVHWYNGVLGNVTTEAGPAAVFILYMLAGASQLASP